jgi:hypothetical protein
MVVNPSLPTKTVSEFIAYAKANPGKVNMGSQGVGSIGHLAGEFTTSTDSVGLMIWDCGPTRHRPPNSASSSSRKPRNGQRWSKPPASSRSDRASAQNSVTSIQRMSGTVHRCPLDDRFRGATWTLSRPVPTAESGPTADLAGGP